MSSIPTLTKMRTYTNNTHVLTFYNACPNSIYNLSLHVLLIVLMSICNRPYAKMHTSLYGFVPVLNIEHNRPHLQ